MLYIFNASLNNRKNIDGDYGFITSNAVYFDGKDFPCYLSYAVTFWCDICGPYVKNMQ